MIELKEEAGDLFVFCQGEELNVLDAGNDYVLAECDLNDLLGETANSFPEKLQLQIQSPDGFGTYLFHELRLSRHDEGVALDFVCHTPNKHWEGRFGLATFLAAVRDQVQHVDNLQVTGIELEDDYKGITLRRILASGDPIQQSVTLAADQLRALLHAAEVALAGVQWKHEYETDEDLFCREVIAPLLRRMGFVMVRYRHGTREYGKDFTFSEVTPFGDHRNYGMQCKAGNVSGEVNSLVDELLGRIEDAFSMPYLELGSKEPRYISTFIIAISGAFTANAREKIAEKIPKGLIGSLYFLDRERIEELVERYWHTQ